MVISLAEQGQSQSTLVFLVCCLLAFLATASLKLNLNEEVQIWRRMRSSSRAGLPYGELWDNRLLLSMLVLGVLLDQSHPLLGRPNRWTGCMFRQPCFCYYFTTGCICSVLRYLQMSVTQVSQHHSFAHQSCVRHREAEKLTVFHNVLI